MKRAVLILAALLLLAAAALFAAGRGWTGRHEGPGEPTAQRRSEASVAAHGAQQGEAAGRIGLPRAKQILFGDLHVHSTVSFDAFLFNAPLFAGEGSHPQADACDFARFCSALDFWSINDHAEAITPRVWEETIDAIRTCNEIGGEGPTPDTVAFLGWEWTQMGTTPQDHYGHKNVVLAHTDDARIPTRPIAALGTYHDITRTQPGALGRGMLAWLGGDARYHDMARYYAEREGTTLCPADVPVRDLPPDCLEATDTPGELFAKLDDWGHDALVIPHGTTWGIYTPPGSDWRKQLTAAQHDPERQTLIEVYSGHGDSERYRGWREIEFDADGTPRCPAPRDDYLPTCWRAGELIRSRCLDAGESPETCEGRAATARRNAADAGLQAPHTVPGASVPDWLDAGQCRDCDQPAFNYRPLGAAQYILALGRSDSAPGPRRFRLGFIASSDTHFARPGTGYKEMHRVGFSDSAPLRDVPEAIADTFQAAHEAPVAESRPFDLATSGLSAYQLLEAERQTSFFMTGGLVAAHAAGRDRNSIWDALERREVYATSGPRILLWFDLLNPPGTRGATAPMGSSVAMSGIPLFQAAAVGSFEQQPGCPDESDQALSAERLAHLCKNECYHPGEVRRPITRLEVVRIRPQAEAGEALAPLIEDPWRIFPCEPDPAGCSVTFSDPEYPSLARDALYYVRAYEAEAPAINADALRCRRDAEGRCLEVRPCGDDPSDDCLAPHEPRAWSSPLFLDRPAPAIAVETPPEAPAPELASPDAS